MPAIPVLSLACRSVSIATKSNNTGAKRIGKRIENWTRSGKPNRELDDGKLGAKTAVDVSASGKTGTRSTPQRPTTAMTASTTKGNDGHYTSRILEVSHRHPVAVISAQVNASPASELPPT
ncbi:uncharacterized protein ARMOST_05967 [Armillaria ostoyae]|uniref:Uncharacterized protein n=1 Tax=Armillaria ostoyae TaxID=47428 RepID=A0A284R1Q9_ARMOS|nr:uncharacterized protein ARMOST_05967 [Armillaria ostoyae]